MRNRKNGYKGRRLAALALCAALLVPVLGGCAQKMEDTLSQAVPKPQRDGEGTRPGETAETVETEGIPTTEATIPATIPGDGDPDSVTCKGSYTVHSGDAAGTVVASAGGEELTNGLLQVYYWLEAARYRQAGHDTAPDFSKPLDTQVCEVDGQVASWQQYFLRRALNTWHSCAALVQQSREVPLATEEAFQPNPENYEIYMTDIPATKVLYGFNQFFQPNGLHQAYLDSLPELLRELAEDKGMADADALARTLAGEGTSGEELLAFAEAYNLAYMYFTTLQYGVSVTEEDVDGWLAEHGIAYSREGSYVDIRHVLLIPEEATLAKDGAVSCSDEAWDACESQAQAMLDAFLKRKDTSEPRFAELANQNSADAGSSINGGLYQNLHRGQLDEPLDSWCFDSARQPGDTAVLRSDCGVHILYFSGSRTLREGDARADALAYRMGQLVSGAREAYPMTVDYSAIGLCEAENSALVSADTLLYPDIAHERYDVVPLYLQQDYPTTYYGNYKISSHGCGITTLAMLASYLSDTELTPPEMCDRYGKYCLKTGTNTVMFEETPAEMGFYLYKKTFDWKEVREAMENGMQAVSLQHKGYFTRGGHCLLLEEIVEDGEVQIRDSNIYNYGKLHGHKEDSFNWDKIVPAGACYWIFQPKVTRIPTCVRCGEAGAENIPWSMFTERYQCEKCDAALLRRNSFMEACGG